MKKTTVLKTICITALLLVTVVIFSGCVPKPPNGYVKSGHGPIQYNESFLLYTQFKNLNPFEMQSMTKMFFSFEGDTLFIQEEKYPQGGMYSVYRDTEVIGHFIKAESVVNFDAIFLHENYLYYGFRKTASKKYFFLNNHGLFTYAYYDKYEFYRFDLETGQNESIDVNQFYDKLRIYYSGATLK